MAVELAGTDGDPVTDSVSSGTGHSFAYTIPSDATAIIIDVTGVNNNKNAAGLLDKANWDDGPALDFDHVFSQRFNSSYDEWVKSFYIMTADDANWPGTGAKTLYWENRTTSWAEGLEVTAFAIKGVHQTGPIGETDGLDDPANAQELTFGDNTSETLHVIGLYQYNSTAVGALDENSQTVVAEGGVGNVCAAAVAVKANADSLTWSPTAVYDVAAGFTLLPAPVVVGGSIMNQLQSNNMGADLYNGVIT